MEFKALVSSSNPETTTPKPKSKKTNNQEQQRQVLHWQQSGLSQSEFCKQRGINPKTFGHWLKKHGGTSASSSIPPSEVFPPMLPKTILAIDLNNGTRLSFKSGFDLGLLKLLLKRI